MKLSAVDIQFNHHKKTLELRKFDRVVQSSGFQDAYKIANQSDRWDVSAIIIEGRLFDLKHWIRRHLYNDFKNHSVAELRILASAHQIKYYSRLTKAELISKLIKKGLTDGDSKGYAGNDYKSIREDETIIDSIRHTSKSHPATLRTTSHKNLH